MDDVGDTFAEATALSPLTAVSLNRRIETVGDRDMFQITLEAGQTVELVLSPADSGDVLEFGVLEVFDADGTLLDLEENLDPQDDANIVFQAPATGTYFVAVTGDNFAGAALGTGDYVLQSRPQTALRDPEGDAPETALDLNSFGTSTHSIVNIDDEDLFRIDVEAGERVRAEVRGTGSDPLTTGSIAAANEAGVIFEAASFNTAAGAVIEFTPTGTGPFFLGVAGFNETDITDFGTYELSFAPVQVQEDPDLSTTAALVSAPGVDGQAIISFSLDNLSEQVLENVSFSIVLTDDTTVDASDIVLLREGPVTLGAQSSFSVTTGVEVPADTADGVYAFAVIVDPDNVVAEVDETNNFSLTESFEFAQPGTPDLSTEALSVTTTSGSPADVGRSTQGDVLNAVLEVSNVGDSASEPFEVRFELGYPGTSVTTVETIQVAGLAPTERAFVEASLRIPDGLNFSSGLGTVTASVDLAGAVAETNLANNAIAPAQVLLEDRLADDHGDDFGSGTPILPGEEIEGVIQANTSSGLDEDFFTFVAAAGDRFRFTLLPDGSLTDPLAQGRADVIAGDGGREEFGVISGAPLVISGIAQTSGPQAVEVHTRFLDGNPNLGGYTVRFDSLTSRVADDHSDAREDATALEFNTRATGTLDGVNDVDVFAIDRGSLGAFTVQANKLTGSDGISVRVLESYSAAQTFPQSTVIEEFAGTTVGRSYSKTLNGVLGDGPVFIEVSGTTGTYELEVAVRVTSDDPRLFFDGSAFDDLRGQVNGADIFVMADDGVRDLIRNFEFGLDRIDVSEFGVERLEDLVISNQLNRSGVTSWVNVSDASGDVEIGVRFGDGTALDAAAFTPGDFIFLPPTARTAGIQQQDTAGFNDFRGVRGSELYVLQDDGVRDLIRAFEFGLDQIDVSAFAENISDLTITNQTRGNGTVNWVNIADFRGEIEVGLRFGDGTPLDAGAFSARDFIFSDVPIQRDQTLEDLPGFTDLAGADTRDTFVMLDDGVRDLIRDFDPTTDLIDVSGFAESIADLTITNQTRGNGSVSWVQIADFFGEVEMALRFDGGALDASRLGADNFIFSEEPIERAPLINVLTDTDGFTDLRATAGADVFVMRNDDVRDIIRGFQPGVDQIDLTDYNLGVFGGNIVAENLLRRDGSVTFVEVFVDRGGFGIGPDQQADFIMRFDGSTTLDRSSLSDSDFIF